MSSTALARANSVSSRTHSPSTPAQQSQHAPPAVATPQQPGTWRHPRMDEITRRQNASVFNSDNIHQIAMNGLLLVASVFSPNIFTPASLLALLNSFEPYTAYALIATRLLILLNIAAACAPLFRPKDDLSDIPLTPSQRSLLGLSPSLAPLTPGQQYTTPPRYTRSSTPRSNASAHIAASGSPSSFRGGSPSSLDRSTMGHSRPASGSPYSSSPLVQKALGTSAARRLSFTPSSPQDLAALPLSANGTTGVPVPPATGIANGKASVGLNSKWLYERGRSSPSGRGLIT
ncbi:hypothetical protein MBLNU459_g3167t2 [Dothideomycetes sp. NU459]